MWWWCITGNSVLIARWMDSWPIQVIVWYSTLVLGTTKVGNLREEELEQKTVSCLPISVVVVVVALHQAQAQEHWLTSPVDLFHIDINFMKYTSTMDCVMIAVPNTQLMAIPFRLRLIKFSLLGLSTLTHSSQIYEFLASTNNTKSSPAANFEIANMNYNLAELGNGLD